MVKFFRHIRRRYLMERQTPKYLKYALGEIVLVVLGILIALQINNWNEQRKEDNLEQDYLIALKREFENNTKEADRVIALNARLLKSAQELSKHTGPGVPSISEETFAKLFFGTVNAEVQYRPGSGVTNEILNSGKLNIFRNKELKNALATLDGLLLKIRYQESEEMHYTRYGLISMGYDKVGLRRMAYDTFGEHFGLDRGRFLESNLHLLASIQFDNLVMGFIFTTGYLDGRYKGLKEQLQEIIVIINSQIE